MQTTRITDFGSLVAYIIELINLIIPVIFGLILVVIIWRLVSAWIINGGDEAKVKEGKQTAIVGIIVLVILSAVWGILNLLRSALFGL